MYKDEEGRVVKYCDVDPRSDLVALCFGLSVPLTVIETFIDVWSLQVVSARDSASSIKSPDGSKNTPKLH